MTDLPRALDAALNRLAKWRMVFAGWQLGTRPKGDAECDAVRDHREATLLLRAEVNALNQLLIAKGVYTFDEFQRQLLEEAGHLNRALERQFPGIRASADGIVLTPEAQDTMKGWKP